MEDMTYPQLKSECAKLGIDAKGTKEVLMERLNEYYANSLKEETALEAMEREAEEGDVKHIDTYELAGEIVREDSVIEEVSASRAEELVAKCNRMFAGRAVATCEGNMIHFRGGPKKAADFNINQPDAVIISGARYFVARVRDEHGKVGEAESRPADIEAMIDGMSQDQLKRLRSKLGL